MAWMIRWFIGPAHTGWSLGSPPSDRRMTLTPSDLERRRGPMGLFDTRSSRTRRGHNPRPTARGRRAAHHRRRIRTCGNPVTTRFVASAFPRRDAGIACAGRHHPTNPRFIPADEGMAPSSEELRHVNQGTGGKKAVRACSGSAKATLCSGSPRPEHRIALRRLEAAAIRRTGRPDLWAGNAGQDHDLPSWASVPSVRSAHRIQRRCCVTRWR
jgi:hypothetical protein